MHGTNLYKSLKSIQPVAIFLFSVIPLAVAQNYTISTVAGNGKTTFSGDGGPATSAGIAYPAGLAIDAAGNLYIADAGNDRIRKVAANGLITTVAGNGTRGFSGDGGPATNAALQLNYLSPTSGLAIDSAGNLYVADSGNNRIRKVAPNGIITTIGGGGSSYGDGGPATSAEIINPAGLACDSAGNLFVSEDYVFEEVVRKIALNGVITTVAGSGNPGDSGDGGAATKALLNGPEGLTVDSAGNLYIAERSGRIRKVDPNGIINTVAGDGGSTYDGDGTPATSFSLNTPFGVAVDGGGNLYIADTNNYRIRRVSGTGTITTIGGNGDYGFAGDGGPATSAELSQPDAITIDPSGNLYISDLDSNRVRRLVPSAATPISTGPPILFVHGFCDTAASWAALQGQVISFLTAPTSGFGYSNSTGFVLYYDGNVVRQYPNGSVLTTLDPTARFFLIDFYAPGSFPSSSTGSIDATLVANVSILNKADELAHVIQAITTLTGSQQVLVIAHSMGGLVTRAYMETLASPYVGLCSPATGYKQCSPGSTPYQNDILKAITLDTPHSGAMITSVPDSLASVLLWAPCYLSNTLNLTEMNPGSTVLDLLYQAAAALPQQTPIAAIESYTNPGTDPFLSGPDDFIVMQAEQSVLNSISGTDNPVSADYDRINPFSSVPCTPPVLHLLTCVGAQPQTASVVESEIEKAITAGSTNSPPTISEVANAFGGSQTIAANTWVAITGTNLAPDARTWQGYDFLNGRMPTSLDGVSATVNGYTAYVEYISNSQVNILTPPFAISGPLNVVLTNNGTTASFIAQAGSISPSFFVFDTTHVVAQHLNYTDVGPPTLYPGLTTPAKPGEEVVLYANGFGPTSMPVVNGVVTQGGTLGVLPVVMIGGVQAQVLYAGLAGPGEFQVNVVVPPNTANGDIPLTASYNGQNTQPGVVITVKQ